MTTEEYINFSNKLGALSYDLLNKKNVEFGLTFRKERVKGQFCDVTITFYNDDMSTKIIYRYKFFKKYSLSEAEDMFEDMMNVIHTLA